MVRVVALDIGSGYTKCFDGNQRIIFPSVYSYLWEDKEGLVEAVGEKALEIAQDSNVLTFYPIVEGMPQPEPFFKLTEGALHRLRIHSCEDVCLITGLPYETGEDDRERIEKLLKDKLHLREVIFYPQAAGTLFDLGLESATVINIGHGTTEIAVIEKHNVVCGISEPLASDYIVTSLSNFIRSKHGLEPTTDSLTAFISERIDAITAFEKNFVHRKGADTQIQSVVDQTVVDYLAEKIANDARHLLTQLSPNLDCATPIVLSGGGSLIAGIREAIDRELNCKLLVPSDPIFSNVLGFYKMGRKL